MAVAYSTDNYYHVCGLMMALRLMGQIVYGEKKTLIFQCKVKVSYHSFLPCRPIRLTTYSVFFVCVSVRLLTASALQMVLATWRQSVRSQALLTVSSPASWKLNNKFSCSVGGRTTKANAFTHSEGRK